MRYMNQKQKKGHKNNNLIFLNYIKNLQFIKQVVNFKIKVYNQIQETKIGC